MERYINNDNNSISTMYNDLPQQYTSLASRIQLYIYTNYCMEARVHTVDVVTK